MNSRIVAAALLLCLPQLAWAQVAVTPGTEAVTPPTPIPAWAFYYNPETGTYLRPILGVAGGLSLDFRTNQLSSGTSQPLEPIYTALAMAIFGVEGRLRDWATVHVELRRDLGNYGTSVWEGQAALSALDNYVRLEHWGARLAAGIVSDPSSADFTSAHMADLFMADSMSRTPLLYSGFNRGQGLLAQYNWRWLTAGVFVSAGNPLTTSASFAFKGNITPAGTIYTVPTRGQFESGNPVPGTEFDLVSPSLIFESKYLDARANVQFHFVNIDTESDKDQRLAGELFRFGIRGKIWDNHIVPFANIAYRRNDMVTQSPLDITTKDPNSYKALVASGGLDLNLLGYSGVGVNYAFVRSKQGELDTQEWHYLNVGATYWIVDNLSASLRYTHLVSMTKGETADGVPERDSLFLVLRFVI